MRMFIAHYYLGAKGETSGSVTVSPRVTPRHPLGDVK